MRETTAAAFGLFMFVCVAASGGYLVSAGLIRTNGQGFGAGGDSSFWNPKVDGNEGYEHHDDDNDDYEDEHHSPGHHHNFHHNHHHGFHHNHDDHFQNFHHDHHRSGHQHDQWRNREDGYHHRNFETGKIPHFHNHDHHDQNYHNHHNYHHHHSFHNEHQPIEPEHQGKGFPYDEVHEDQSHDIQPKQIIDNKKCEVPSVVGVGAIAEEENQKQTPNLVLDLVDSNSTLVQVIEDTSTMIIDSDNLADSETPATVVTEKAADSIAFSSADNESAPKSETTTCVSLEEKTVTPTISDYIEPGSGDATSNSQSEETSADPTDTPSRGPLNEAGLPTAIDIRIDQGGSDFDSVN